jgi:hypothetical protein
VPRSDTPRPPIPYTNFFCLNTSGSNLYIFSAPSSVQANTWVNSIRLSSWEISKLCQLFTYRILSRPGMKQVWDGLGVEVGKTIEFRGTIGFEGVVMVNFGGSDEWRMLFAVVSSVVVNEEEELEAGVESTGKTAKKMFFKQKKEPKKRKSVALGVRGSRHGTILFWRSKKERDKGVRPAFHVPYVRAAYALWPETPDAPVCLGKLECSVLTVPRSATKPKEIDPVLQFGGIDSMVSDAEVGMSRVASSHLFISVEGEEDLARWVVAVSAAFNVGMGGEGRIGELVQEMVPVVEGLGGVDKGMEGLGVGESMVSESGVEKSGLEDLESLYDAAAGSIAPASPTRASGEKDGDDDSIVDFEGEKDSLDGASTKRVSADSKSVASKSWGSKSAKGKQEPVESKSIDAKSMASKSIDSNPTDSNSIGRSVDTKSLESAAPSTTDRKLKDEITYAPGQCIPKNLEWGLLYLNVTDVSSIEIASSVISCERPVSTEATARILFEGVWKEKCGSALAEWNGNVRMTEGVRRSAERRQIEGRVRELVVWFGEVRDKALGFDEGFDPAVEFKKTDVESGDEKDSWALDDQRFLLRIVPIVAEDGVVSWEYRQVNSVLYDRFVGAYNMVLKKKKRKSGRPVSQAVMSEKKAERDSLVGAYIASDEEGGDENDDGSDESASASESDDERPLVKLWNIVDDDSSDEEELYLPSTLLGKTKKNKYPVCTVYLISRNLGATTESLDMIRYWPQGCLKQSHRPSHQPKSQSMLNHNTLATTPSSQT